MHLPTEVNPGASSDSDQGAADHRLRHRDVQTVFWVALGVMVAIALARNAYVFRVPIHEGGDQALNSLLTQRALEGRQYVGNYSRVGFHHPGPALLYVLLAGQGIFFSALHLVPTQFNGQLVGNTVFAASLLSLAVVAIYRSTRSWAAAAVAGTVLFAFGMRHMMFVSVWFPYQYMPAFLLLTVAGACVAAGRTTEWPSFVAAAMLLVHGHVSFIATAGVTLLASGACWYLHHRQGVRAELARHRTAALGSAGIVVLFLIPLVLEVVLHFPGPWLRYYHYLGQGLAPRTPRQVAGFFGWFWSGGGLPPVLTLAAVVLAVALVATGRRRPDEKVFGYIYAMVTLQSALFLVYIDRGVDALTVLNHYTGLYYLTVPAALTAAAGAQLGLRLRAVAPPQVGARTAVAAVTLVALLFVAAVHRQPRNEFVGGLDYLTIAARLGETARTEHATIGLYVHSAHWKTGAGIMIAAEREQVPACVLDTAPNLVNLFTRPFLCPANFTGDTVDLGRPHPRQVEVVLYRHDNFVVSQIARQDILGLPAAP